VSGFSDASRLQACAWLIEHVGCVLGLLAWRAALVAAHLRELGRQIDALRRECQPTATAFSRTRSG